MSDFKPSSFECHILLCPHLVEETVDTVAGPRVKKVCDITGKIPGNMARCPLQEEI